MNHALSILIPTYNTDCTQLVLTLHAQAASIPSLTYEIIVADDGSTDAACIEKLERLNRLDNVSLISNRCNIGRAAIRNVLARKAQYATLLFIDSDMQIASANYLNTYLSQASNPVVYGGYTLATPYPRNPMSTYLRYRYETKAYPRQTAEQRRRHPYRDFHTANFLVAKAIMQRHPFDERIRHYGYEDVLWGKQMKTDNTAILHIDNPVVFSTYEDNATFLDKTEESLRTLHQFSEELKGYSTLLDFSLAHPLLCRLVRHWHTLFGRLERKALLHNNTPIALFNLYKLGYFISLQKA